MCNLWYQARMLQWCATCWHVSHAIVLAAHVAAEFMHPAWLVDTAKHCIQKPLPAGGCKLGDAVLADLVEQLNACAADVPDDEDMLPMHWAAEKGQTDACQLLLDAAPNTITAADWYDKLPVHWAAEKGHTATCQLLLDAAPETNHAADQCGKLPLHWAAGFGHTATCQLLLDAAPETITAADQYGMLPVHWAAEKGHTATCQLLLDAAPETNSAADQCGKLPVHWAAACGHTATCQLLLDRAPQTAVMVDFAGRTPLQCALLAVHHHIPMCLDAARCLVAAAPVASVLAALSAVPEAQPLFADFFITRSPHLTSAEWTAAWSAVPVPCSGLLRALPAVLGHSAEQAPHLVQHLPPADVQRLRTAALCLARAQKQSGVALPSGIVWQVLQLMGA
jgi:ankyrin repeat protein